MITLEEYLRDPCGTLSIPWWKWRGMRIPENMKILHSREYQPADGYQAEAYFRLIHSLEGIRPGKLEGYEIRTADTRDYDTVAVTINSSYPDLRISREQLEAMARSGMYHEQLWVLAVDRNSGKIAGSGIGAWDRESGEGSLEWIQVLPQYRRQGIGGLIVGELLGRMAGKARFVTVSGQCGNRSNPEALYRSCGFTGNDIWYVLKPI